MKIMGLRIAGNIALIVLATTAGAVLAAALMALIVPPVHHNANGHANSAKPTSSYDEYFGGRPRAGSHGTGSADGKAYDFWYGRFAQRLHRKDEEAINPSIIVLGCSLAWGAGLDGEKSFAARLQRTLGVEVMNAAVSGSGTIYMGRRLMMLPDDVKRNATTVVYLLYEDHLYRNVRRCAPMDTPICLQLRHIGFDDGVPVERGPSYPVEQIFGGPYALIQWWYRDQYAEVADRSFAKDVLWSLYRFYAAADKLVHREPNWQNPDARPKVMAALDYSLGVMANEVRKLNARFLVLWVPIYAYPKPLSPMSKDVADIVNKYSDDLIDLAAPFNATLAESHRGAYPFTIPNDGHFSERGHQIVTDLIAGRLQNQAAAGAATR